MISLFPFKSSMPIYFDKSITGFADNKFKERIEKISLSGFTPNLQSLCPIFRGKFLISIQNVSNYEANETLCKGWYFCCF